MRRLFSSSPKSNRNYYHAVTRLRTLLLRLAANFSSSDSWKSVKYPSVGAVIAGFHRFRNGTLQRERGGISCPKGQVFPNEKYLFSSLAYMGKLARHLRMKKTRWIIARPASGFLQTRPTSLAPFHAQARSRTQHSHAHTRTHEHVERTHERALAVPSIVLPYAYSHRSGDVKAVARQRVSGNWWTFNFQN